MAKAFAFRLETLLGLRRLKEDVARSALERARQAVATQNQALTGLLREDAEEKDALRELRRAELDLVQVRLHQGYLNALEHRIRREFESLQGLSRTETERRRGLTQALKEVKILERLRERQLKAHRAEADREERNFLDEVAQRSRMQALGGGA